MKKKKKTVSLILAIARRQIQPTYAQIIVSGKLLHGSGLVGIENIPVVYGRVSNKTNCSITDPLPKDHIFVHRCGLELLLGLQVENLQRS